MASLSLRQGSQELVLLSSWHSAHVSESSHDPCFKREEGFSIKYACNGHETYWLNGKKLHLAPGEALLINHQFSFSNRFQADRLSQGLCVYYSELEMQRLCTSLFSVGAIAYPSLRKLPEYKFSKESELCTALACFYKSYQNQVQSIDKQSLHLTWLEALKSIKPEHVNYAARLVDLAPATRQSLINKINRANAYMIDMIAQPIQLEDISKQVGMSAFHFQRQYKKATGESPNRFLVQQRIKKAKELIMAGNLQILEIATLLAYNDLATFSKAFKREVGLSPMQWRKKNAKN